MRRQLKNSMALVDKLQAELQRVTDTEAEKYAGDKADRTAAYFELESTLHKTRAEKTKLVRENKQLQRKVEKIESANSGAAAQGMLTDGGWCVCCGCLIVVSLELALAAHKHASCRLCPNDSSLSDYEDDTTFVQGLGSRAWKATISSGEHDHQPSVALPEARAQVAEVR